MLGRQNVFPEVPGEGFRGYLREERFFACESERCCSGDSRLAEEDADLLFRDFWAGTDEAHVSAKDVEELG